MVLMWLKLETVAAAHDIDWQWVKAHAGNPGNERANDLAEAAARK